MGQYQTIKTQAGLGLEVTAETGGPAIKLVSMSVGDGGGNATQPSATQTALVHEVDRVSLNSLRQNATDATQWEAQAVFSADTGGYTVREVGLWTDGGVLFAVANFPDTYKPAPSEGTAGQLLISLNFRAQNSDNITLVVDGNLQLATINYVDGKTAAISDDVQAETKRAKSVESGLVSGIAGVPGGGSPGMSLFTDGSGIPVFTDQENGPRRLALAENSVTSPAANDSGYSVDTLGINRQTGQMWVHNATTGNFLFLQGAGNYANSSDLAAETQRAETAEAGLLPLTGGTLSGTLFLSANAGDTNLQIKPQNGMNGYVSVYRDGAYQQFGCAGGRIDQTNIIMYRQDLSEYKRWSFDRPSGTIISPFGGIYPEVIGMSGRVVMQIFTYTKPPGVTWTYVPFPTAFSPGTVPFVLPANTTNPGANPNSYSDAAYPCVVQQGNGYLTTNQGFTLLPYGNQNPGGDQKSQAQIQYQFLAIGVM